MAQFETQPRPEAADLGYEVKTAAEPAGLKPTYPLIEDAGEQPAVVEVAPTASTPVVETETPQTFAAVAPKPFEIDAEPTTLNGLEQSLYGSL